jgi:hypothetical protein
MLQRGCGEQRIDDGRWMAGIAPHGAADGAPAALSMNVTNGIASVVGGSRRSSSSAAMTTTAS